SQLLDKIHQQIIPIQSVTLNSNCELKFKEVIKKAKKSCNCATDLFLKKLTDNKLLRKNFSYVILKDLETLLSEKIKNEPSEITLITNHLDYIMKGIFHHPNKHIVQWSNTVLNESKSRKFEGQSKQPNFVVSVIYQLQIEAVVFVGEVSSPSQKNNVYKNCNNLIQIGVIIKDCMDFSIDKGANINVIGFQCIDKKINLIKGTYFMLYIGQISVLTSVKEILFFVDEIETLLGVQEIFQKIYNTIYDKFCNPELPTIKTEFKCDTLNTPKFN
ncbi:9229_t:CDS:2, partial [Diversispora eburnea]